MIKVIVALTCFNRAEKTVNCVESLVKYNSNLDFYFVIVDDNSSDDTVARLNSLEIPARMEIIETEGNLYYSGGMKVALEHILSEQEAFADYVLLVNDDVLFLDKAIEKMVQQEQIHKGVVIVGATCDAEGNQSYGAVKYDDRKHMKAKKLTIHDCNVEADTFNANCVLIPMDVIRRVGGFDAKFIHSLGDYDYGLQLSERGNKIFSTSEYVGICNKNSKKGTWLDTTLPRLKRIKLKESIKGSPMRQWWYFTKKHFGYHVAVKSLISPYIRIIFRK